MINKSYLSKNLLIIKYGKEEHLSNFNGMAVFNYTNFAKYYIVFDRLMDKSTLLLNLKTMYKWGW